MDIDKKELEKQYRKSILDSGKYVRLEILIGSDNIDLDGKKGTMPFVMLDLNHANAKSIGYMYLSLEKTMKNLEKEFPAACLASKLTASCKDLGRDVYNTKDFTLDD